MTNDRDMEVIPTDLLDPPAAEFPSPPVETSEQLLPLDALRWEDFERLCLRVARLEGTPVGARRFGVKGQAQAGIDLYSELPSGRYASYQCRRVASFGPGDITAAVDDFLQGRWSRKSDRFVLCTSKGAVRTELEEAIAKQRRRLRKRARSIDFEVWDAEELSLMLKDQGEIVRDFFGPVWADRFLGSWPTADSMEEVKGKLDELLARSASGVQLVTYDWATERLREQADALAEKNPHSFGLLKDQRSEVRLGRSRCAPPHSTRQTGFSRLAQTSWSFWLGSPKHRGNGRRPPVLLGNAWPTFAQATLTKPRARWCTRPSQRTWRPDSIRKPGRAGEQDR